MFVFQRRIICSALWESDRRIRNADRIAYEHQGDYYASADPENAGRDRKLMRKTAVQIRRNMKYISSNGMRLSPAKMDLLRYCPSAVTSVILGLVFRSEFGNRFMYQHSMKAPDEMRDLHKQFYGYLRERTVQNDGFVKREFTTMKTAAKLMKKKAFIKDELDKVVPKEQSDYLWKVATKKLNAILNKYGDLPKGVQSHTNSIFPAAAVYLTVKRKCGKDLSYGVIENAAINLCAKAQPSLARFMRLPGLASLFVKIWDPMTKKKFGPKCGFENRFYPKSKGEYRMDILACPYFRYFSELGCPELTKIYCENDERMYGNLPGLKFERTGTIGKGSDHCDFYLRRVKG